VQLLSSDKSGYFSDNFVLNTDALSCHSNASAPV